MKWHHGRFFLIANVLNLLSSKSHNHSSTILVEFDGGFDSISPPAGFVPFIAEYPLPTYFAGTFWPLISTGDVIKLIPVEATPEDFVVVSINSTDFDFRNSYKSKSNQDIDCFCKILIGSA